MMGKELTWLRSWAETSVVGDEACCASEEGLDDLAGEGRPCEHAEHGVFFFLTDVCHEVEVWKTVGGGAAGEQDCVR